MRAGDLDQLLRAPERAGGTVPWTYEQAKDAIAALQSGMGPAEIYSGHATLRALQDTKTEFVVKQDANGMVVAGPTMTMPAPTTKKAGRKRLKKKGGKKKKKAHGSKLKRKKKKKK